MRPTIDNVRGLGEFQSMYRWNLEITSFPESLANHPTAEELNFRCTSTTLPKSTNNDVLINMRGHTIEMPGKQTFERRMTLIFLETVDNKIAQFFTDWRKLVWSDITGITENKKDLESTMKIERLNNKDEAIWEYVLTGCFPKDFILAPLVEESDEVMKPELLLTYDYFREGTIQSGSGSVVTQDGI